MVLDKIHAHMSSILISVDDKGSAETGREHNLYIKLYMSYCNGVSVFSH